MITFNLLDQNHLNSILGINFDNFELFNPYDRHSILSVHFRILLKLYALHKLFKVVSYLVRHFLFNFVKLLKLPNWIYSRNICLERNCRDHTNIFSVASCAHANLVDHRRQMHDLELV